MSSANDFPHQECGMDWKSFTEFFEGEGAISCRVHKRRTRNYVLAILIVIGQKWEPKLKQLERFLASQGIASRLYSERAGHSLRIFQASSVRELLERIEPFSFLKRPQIMSARQYLSNKITGDEFLRTLSKEYANGKRRRAPPRVDVPYRREEGLRIARKLSPWATTHLQGSCNHSSQGVSGIPSVTSV